MRTAALALLVIVTSVSATAQVNRGLQELNGSGSLSIDDDFTQFVLDVSYGYFLTNNFELGPKIQVVRFSDGDDSSTGGLVGGFGHLHFGRGRSFLRRGARTVPFVGFEAGAGVGDAEGAIFGLLGGAKFFIADGAALTPTAFLQFDDEGNSTFGARFGVSAFF